MFKRHTLRAFLLAFLCAPIAAQQAPDQPGKQPAAGPEEPKPDPAKGDGSLGSPEEMKVLKPVDVAAERSRIKTKADIKCEVTMIPTHGREVTVKGVVRNGKLIERFAGRVFVEDPNIESPQCGVRLWWVDNTAGWIFLRYSQIRSIALRGVLTAEEREEIMKRLKARADEEKEQRKAAETAKLEEELLKMSGHELEAYLLREYPEAKGWNHEKLRELKKKHLIDNQTLTREESIFVAYFPVLIRARLTELKREKDKIEIEPGSAETPADPRAGKPGRGDDSEPESGDHGNADAGGSGSTGDTELPPFGGGAADEEPADEDEGCSESE